MIRFEATLYKLGKWTILKVPQDISDALPSRGQVMVKGTLQGFDIEQVLEPDGTGGHWLKVHEKLQQSAKMVAGDTVTLDVQLSREWREPTKPPAFEQALANAPIDVQKLWDSITPMARWEWVRWINSTNVPETRARRVEVSISKMQSGKRRPCCFNLSSCTDPDLAKSGKLAEPTELK